MFWAGSFRSSKVKKLPTNSQKAFDSSPNPAHISTPTTSGSRIEVLASLHTISTHQEGKQSPAHKSLDRRFAKVQPRAPLTTFWSFFVVLWSGRRLCALLRSPAGDHRGPAMLCGHGSLAMTRMRKGFICADFPTRLHGGDEPRHNITMAMTMMRVMPMMMPSRRAMTAMMAMPMMTMRRVMTMLILHVQ